MTALRCLAPGKVNLSLFVGAPRADGLHPLVSVVQPVSLADELTLEPAPDGTREDEVVCPGIEGPNLAARAATATTRWSPWCSRSRLPTSSSSGPQAVRPMR